MTFCGGDGEEMAKIYTLKRNNEFRRAYEKGKSSVSGVLVSYCIYRKGSRKRCGITTAKKIGCAVKRNRARRIIREAWRQLMPRINRGCDMVFVARTRTAYVKMQSVRDEMEKHLRLFGLIEEEHEQ